MERRQARAVAADGGVDRRHALPGRAPEMSPDIVSKAVSQPGVRAGWRSSGRRSVPASPMDVRAVVHAAVLTGDSSRISADNPAKVTPATLKASGGLDQR